MPAPKVAELVALQEDASHVRNICILAHVDHGKTSLTDSLIASNGIISSRQAGKLRYMDSRDDEQDRGITMKSSAIALIYEGRELINIVDSPGHVDFGSEVSTAIRLSDGAVVVVDAVEGVRVQTHTVLQQVWREGLAPVLFVNKIDRLIVELQLTPEEAFAHLQRIVRQVNDILGGLNSVAHYRSAGERPWDEGAHKAPRRPGAGSAGGETANGGEGARPDFEFRPEDGSVVFGSALHGWAFTAGSFAQLMAPKLGVEAEALRQHMWGEWFWSAKAAGFTQDSAGGRLKPLFAQLALANVWRAHEAAADESADGGARLAKVVGALGLSVSAHELRSSEPSSRVRAVFSAWLPLAPTLLTAIIEHVPAARDAQRGRIEKLWPAQPRAPGGGGAEAEAEAAAVRAAFCACDGSSEHVVVHVSKMFVNGSGEEAVGFARVFAGTLRAGQPLFLLGGGTGGARAGGGGGGGGSVCIGPAGGADGAGELGGEGGSADEPARADGSPPCALPAGALVPYLMMGRDLLPVQAVPAGSLCALGGLGSVVIKGCTLCSAPHLPPFRPVWDATGTGAPIVRVSLEAVRPPEMPILKEALRRLNQADSSVEVSHLPTGELVLGACGEVHLERCLKDLRDDFGRIDISVSQPLIPFREGAAPGAAGTAEAQTADGSWRVRVAARPLPPAAVVWLSRRGRLCLTAGEDGADAAALVADAMTADAACAELSEQALAALERLARGEAPCAADVAAAAELGASAGCGAVALGSAVHPTCVLFALPDVVAALGAARGGAGGGGAAAYGCAEGAAPAALAQLAPALVAGFQLAASAGPLCEEPTAGLAFSVECLERAGTAWPAAGADDGGGAADGSGGGEANAGADGGARGSHFGAVGGQLIAATRSACRQAHLACAPRLVEAVYACALQCTQEVMGRMYGVLSKRRARVTGEEMVEGTPLFVVHAFLPVVESLGFAAEIRKMTSGAAHPQLVFSHWQRLDVDPLETVCTIDDDEFERDSSKNIARAYVRGVRVRKGLPVEEKLVEVATKQRTRARKK